MPPEGIFNNRKPRDATAAALSRTPPLPRCDRGADCDITGSRLEGSLWSFASIAARLSWRRWCRDCPRAGCKRAACPVRRAPPYAAGQARFESGLTHVLGEARPECHRVALVNYPDSRTKAHQDSLARCMALEHGTACGDRSW